MKILFQNIHRRYEYFQNKHCIFWSKNGCFTASMDILNTVLKSRYPQNEKVLEAQILTGLYWDYICSIGNVN